MTFNRKARALIRLQPGGIALKGGNLIGANIGLVVIEINRFDVFCEPL
jgi:hypothetical protein